MLLLYTYTGAQRKWSWKSVYAWPVHKFTVFEVHHPYMLNTALLCPTVYAEVSDRSVASFRVNIDTLGLAYLRVVKNLRNNLTSTLPYQYAEELTRWGSEHEFCALPLVKVYWMYNSRIIIFILKLAMSQRVPAYNYDCRFYKRELDKTCCYFSAFSP